jgi:hypothetical protein
MNIGNRTHRIAGIVSAVLSLAWVALYGGYTLDALGFDTLQALPPDTVASIVFAVVLPPVLIWVIASYWTRGHELAEQTESISRQLERLTIADGQATERVNQVAGALKRQSAEVDRASAQAVAALENIREQFEDQAKELEGAAKAADVQSLTLEARIAEQRRNLGELAGAVDRQKELLSQIAAEQAKAIRNAAEEAAKHVADAFSAKGGEIEGVIDRILEHGNVVQDAIEKQADILKGRARAAAADLEREGDEIVHRIDAVTEGQRKQVQLLLDTTERLSGAFGGVADTAIGRIDGIADDLSQRFGARIEAMQRAGGESEAELLKVVRSKIEETHLQADELVSQLEKKLAVISASRNEIATAEAELRDLLDRQSGALTERSRETLTNLKQQITTELGNITEAVEATEAKQREFDQILGRHVEALGAATAENVRVVTSATAAERERLDQTVTDAEERHRALADVMMRQREAMAAGAEEAAQRFAATLKRHQEMTAANSTAIVADMMRKTGDVQRSIRDQGDSIITAVRGLADDFGGSLNRILEQIANSTERAQADNAVLEQASRAQIERMSHAADIGAQQFRQSLTEMLGQLDGFTRALTSKVSEHNTAIKYTIRTESEEFAASAERAAQLFGRRIAEYAQQIDGATDAVRQRTEGLQEAAQSQGERLASAAAEAGGRFRAEIDLHEKRLVSISDTATHQARSLAEAVDGLAGKLTAAAEQVGERFGKRLGIEQESLARLSEAADQRALTLQQEGSAHAERIGQALEDLLARLSQRVAELSGEVDRQGGRLGEQANAASDRLKERIEQQVRALGEVSAGIGRRADEIDQVLRSESEKLAATTATTGERFRTVFADESLRLGEQAAASAQLLKERIDAEIAALNDLARHVGERAEETDQIIRAGGERVIAAANAAQDGLRATFNAETERLDQHAAAAADQLKQRIESQIGALEALVARIDERAGETDRLIEGGGARITAAVSTAQGLFRETFGAESARLDQRSAAAADALKQRIESQILSLEVLVATVGERSDATDRVIHAEGERMASAASTAQENLRATFAAEIAELNARSGAAGDALKQRIESQIQALDALSGTIHARSDTTDRLVQEGSERMVAAANTAETTFRATFSAETERLDQHATAAADQLKQRIDAQIQALSDLMHAIGQRSDATDHLIHDEGVRLTAAAGAAGDLFQTALNRQAETLRGLAGELTSTTESVTIRTAEIGAAAKAEAERLVASVADGAARFSAAAQEHATELAGAGATAASAFHDRIRVEVDAIEDSLSKLLQQGERMAGTQRNQVAELAAAAGDAASRSEEIRADLADQTGQALAAGATLDRNASEAGRALQAHLAELAQRVPALMSAQAEGIKEASAAAAASAESLSHSLRQQNAELADALEKTSAATQVIRESLAAQIGEMTDTAHRVTDEARAIGAVLRGEVESLGQATGNASSAAGQLQEDMRRHVTELDAVGQRALNGAEALRQNVDRQAELLRAASRETGERSEELAGLYHVHAQRLGEASALASKSLDETGKTMQQQAQALERMIATATVSQRGLSASLETHMTLVDKAGKHGEHEIVTLAQGLTSIADLLRRTTSDSAKQAEEVIHSFREGAEALSDVSRKAALQVTGVKLAVNEQLDELSKISDQVGNLANSVREQLRAHATEFASISSSAKTSAQKAREDTTEMQSIMQVQLASIESATTEMNQQLSLITAEVDRRIREMTDSSIRAVARAGGIGEGFEQQAQKLTKMLQDANKQAGELGEKFRQQSSELSTTSAMAVERIGQLRNTEIVVSRDAFLKTAGAMIEELNGIAVDIHGLLDSEIPDEVWKRYREGDRSVFARRLFRSKDSYIVPALEQRYQRDERFRDLVDRYIRRFETLLGQSHPVDPESVLSATFITADVGKLYLILAKSLGRAVEH